MSRAKLPHVGPSNASIRRDIAKLDSHQIFWREITSNTFVASLCGSDSWDGMISVSRSRSWKRLAAQFDPKQWTVTVFGSRYHADGSRFETLEKAMRFAEQEALDLVRRLAERMEITK